VGLLFLAGALIEITALLLLRLPPSLRHQRRSLATALRAVADYARSPATTSGFPTLTLIDQARHVLTSSSLLGRSDARDLRSVAEALRRVRLGVVTVNGLREQFGDSPDVTLYLGHLADVLEAGANSLNGRREPSDLVALGERGRDARHSENSTPSPEAALVQRRLDELDLALDELTLHLRGDSEEVLEGAWRVNLRWRRPRWREARSSLGVLAETLRRDNPARRHAIRLTLAVIGADLVAHLFGLPRGYWVAFSVAVILKPDYSTLFSRGVGRVVGTLLGATLAALLVAVLHPSAAASAVLIFLLAASAYATWAASFAVSIGLITSVVLVILSLTLTDSVTTALDRLLDVTIGATLSFATYLLWPSPTGSDTDQALENLSLSLEAYLRLVLDALEGDVHPSALRAASRDAHFRFHEAVIAHGRDLVEPERIAAQLDLHQSRLDGGRRWLRATHALRFEAEGGVRCPRELFPLTLEQVEDARALSPELRLLASEIAVSRMRLRATSEESL
jgi:uncharacterized membrane protein YccC